MPNNILGQALLVLGSFSAYLVCLVIYRLYFSSLAKFPGPKLAAATSLYSFFYDVIQGGQYVWAIEDMHKKYGPIVRIRPDVLHLNDPQSIDLVFGTAGKRRDKYKIAINGFGTSKSALGTTHHDLHRSRRAALNPYFSKQSISSLEPILQRTLTKVLGRLSQAAKSGEPMRMDLLNSATTSDIVSEYCFGESSNNLDCEDLNEPFTAAFIESGKGYHFACFNPWIVPLITSLPMKVTVFIMPTAEVFIRLVQDLTIKVDAVQEATKNKIGDNMARTIFHGLLTNPNLPESEKTTARLVDEARVLLAAGTDTTANTLTAITYHVLTNPEILTKLKAELSEAVPDLESLLEISHIETLPYLTAVIQEGIRLHPGASFRQDRVAPDEDLFYEDSINGKKYVIPRGTAIGMTAPLLSRNEEIYPSPLTFSPDRFLENPRLDRYSITFSRGSRRCIGINLAFSELYLMLAGIFRRYDLYDGTGKQTCPTLELFETGREDVDMAADYVTPFLKAGSLGVRLRVR